MKNGHSQWEDGLLSWMGRVSSLKMPVLAKGVCMLRATSVKIDMNKSTEEMKIDYLDCKSSRWAMELLEGSG